MKSIITAYKHTTLVYYQRSLVAGRLTLLGSATSCMCSYLKVMSTVITIMAHAAMLPLGQCRQCTTLLIFKTILITAVCTKRRVLPKNCLQGSQAKKVTTDAKHFFPLVLRHFCFSAIATAAVLSLQLGLPATE